MSRGNWRGGVGCAMGLTRNIYLLVSIGLISQVCIKVDSIRNQKNKRVKKCSNFRRWIDRTRSMRWGFYFARGSKKWICEGTAIARRFICRWYSEYRSNLPKNSGIVRSYSSDFGRCRCDVLGVGKEGIAEVYYAAVVQLQKRYVHFLFTRSSSQKTADFETHIASIADTATTNINEGLAKFSRSAYVAIINETWPKMYEQFFNVSWLLR